MSLKNLWDSSFGALQKMDACITRLRITVADIGKADTEKLKALGATGVLTVGNSLQAIFGPRSENLMTDMKEYLKHAGEEAELGADEATSAAVISTDEPRPQHRDTEASQKAGSILAALGGLTRSRT